MSQRVPKKIPSCSVNVKDDDETKISSDKWEEDNLASDRVQRKKRAMSKSSTTTAKRSKTVSSSKTENSAESYPDLDQFLIATIRKMGTWERDFENETYEYKSWKPTDHRISKEEMKGIVDHPTVREKSKKSGQYNDPFYIQNTFVICNGHEYDVDKFKILSTNPPEIRLFWPREQKTQQEMMLKREAEEKNAIDERLKRLKEDLGEGVCSAIEELGQLLHADYERKIQEMKQSMEEKMDSMKQSFQEEMKAMELKFEDKIKSLEKDFPKLQLARML